MKLDLLNAELRSTYRFVPNTPVTSRLGRALLRAGTGALKPPAIPDDVRFERVALAGSPDIHVFAPATRGNGAALFYIHGGGMVIGTPVQDYHLAIDVVQQLGVTVVLAGYRLAPEFPFPTPLEDCARGWAWLIANAPARGIDPARLAIGGQSAGGGLAAMLVQRIHDEGGVQPAAAWLFCPMLDDRTAADRSRDRIRNRLWNNTSNYAGWKSLLGVEPGSPVVPDGAVPSRRGDLSGLPPTWIGTGTVELFYDEDVAYARSLEASDVPVTLDEVPGAPHAFESIAGKTQLARDYNERARRWLAERLGATYRRP